MNITMDGCVTSNMIARMITALLPLVYECFFHAVLANEDYDTEPTEENNTALSSPVSAALFDLDSWVFLCNGALFSPVFIFTSCRCLSSGIAIAPHYIKRNASRYGVDIIFHADDHKQTEYKIGIRSYEVENFILHPFCFKAKVTKPYRQHFGLIVLKGRGMKEYVRPTPISGHFKTKDVGQTLTTCRIVGIKTDDGQLTTEETEMVLMTSSDCLWRLSVPKIGCAGTDRNVRSRQDLCLASIGDQMPKLRIYEGSEITCNGERFGLIVSTGRIRYPHAPVILASIGQFFDNMPDNFETQKSGSSKTPGEIHVLRVILALIIMASVERGAFPYSNSL